MEQAEFSEITRLRPLTDQRKLSDVAATYLREAILSGVLALGDHLIELDIPKKLGVSRMLVHKAIQQHGKSDAQARSLI